MGKTSLTDFKRQKKIQNILQQPLWIGIRSFEFAWISDGYIYLPGTGYYTFSMQMVTDGKDNPHNNIVFYLGKNSIGGKVVGAIPCPVTSSLNNPFVPSTPYTLPGNAFFVSPSSGQYFSWQSQGGIMRGTIRVMQWSESHEIV